eukprot:gnl/Spiro4/23985_TR11876_c0_g1_i1.p2 gnl/Spiro4/23985_TR11876_c0_g1~~gnl/Spiro4/23985_TR11876_c0_g1_i1.p2  ORF type:complete len:171 (-),score=31.71 gnl/Spiro4/23985_TR11876_c0_g1_i1:14-463(-)
MRVVVLSVVSLLLLVAMLSCTAARMHHRRHHRRASISNQRKSLGHRVYPHFRHHRRSFFHHRRRSGEAASCFLSHLGTTTRCWDNRGQCLKAYADGAAAGGGGFFHNVDECGSCGDSCKTAIRESRAVKWNCDIARSLCGGNRDGIGPQ